MKIIRRLLGVRVDPSLQEVVGWIPANPPERGDTILVDEVRHTVMFCRVAWRRISNEQSGWEIKSLWAKPSPGREGSLV